MRFIRRKINEGYFKTPQQLKDNQAKNQANAGLAIAKTTQKLIISKLQPVLNDIIANTCLHVSPNGYFYGFKLSSRRSILIGLVSGDSAVEHSILKLNNQTDDLISKIYFDNSDVLHFSMTLNLVSMQLSTLNTLYILLRCFKDTNTNTGISMLADSNGQNNGMAIVKKEIAESMRQYALSDDKDKDSTIAEILNKYGSVKKIAIDNIFLNFENIDNPTVIINNGRSSGISYDTESSIEENNKKLISAFLDIFTFADDVRFKISYRTSKTYASDLPWKIGNVYDSLPTFTGGVEVSANKEFASTTNKIIAAAAEEMYYGRPDVIEKICNYFNDITPRLTYAILMTIYYYDNNGNFINTCNVLNEIALQISEQDTDDAIVKLGLGWVSKGGLTEEGRPEALKSFNAHVNILAPAIAPRPADIVFDVSNYFASVGPLGSTSKNRSYVAELLYKDIFDYLHNYAVNNGTVTNNVLR